MDSYREAFQKQTKLKLGKRLYSGNGDIFLLKNYPKRVVKVVYDSYDDCPVNKAIRILKYLQRSKNPAVVKLYRVGSFKYDSQTGYYYVMDRLKLLPNHQRDTYADVIRDEIEGGPLLVPDAKVKSFIRAARKIKYEYTDIHGYNIMLDKRGDIKFVDLESFMNDYR